MIVGYFHKGSGLGNQLHRYVATRVLAEDKGYAFSMLNPENFKGTSFMPLVYPTIYNPAIRKLIMATHWNEKKVVENGMDIRGYDPEINFVEDNTVIDGEFQDPRYFEHRLDEVGEWLKVEPLNIDSDTCVIGFRGGEYKIFPDLFLDIRYWDEAIAIMKSLNPNMKFEVHTDDTESARQFFPNYPIFQAIGVNWRAMRYAKYAIIANSSFYIFPRLLSKGKTIAPRYWARHNTGVWALPQNYYKQFDYI